MLTYISAEHVSFIKKNKEVLTLILLQINQF